MTLTGRSQRRQENTRGAGLIRPAQQPEARPLHMSRLGLFLCVAGIIPHSPARVKACEARHER